MNNTIKQYPNNSPFKPSMKFDPLIKIIKQNIQKIIPKNFISIILSNKIILVDEIWISKKYTVKAIISVWIKNLIFGEFKTPISDRKPTEKIEKIAKQKDKFFS
jgi:hypothetical protein